MGIGPGDGVTRRELLGTAVAAIAAVGTIACTSREETAMTEPDDADAPGVDFPDPGAGTVSLDAALRRRRSVREFATGNLTDAEIGQLLWAAQGVTANWGGRTAPSAGALYPLEVYAVTPARTLHYRPDGHRGAVVGERDLRPELQAAALDQTSVGSAPTVVVIVAVPVRTAETYGARATRYVDIEVGHAAQNVLLQAVALGLVAVPIGAFDDDAVAGLLGLADGHAPRYLIPLGRAR